ncbi:hypothetical protein ATEIFO6365_0003089600 [Aspergillus terreus]|uniref:Aminoglycoside phosphotransferase domain-containing protein n=1 Tax=Aspergillus terreus TaxID=33178 RepID=A0A5M3YV01_ASPTE|nr:hypothetical protein ATETN484_0003084200 [Aspergillus terreus]GFF14828.1 hypothetical protein ATEIFO6365_0003089600 [Aspergillus terreus]
MEFDGALRKFVAASLCPSRPVVTLRHDPRIDGDDHMIYFIDEEPGYIMRVTKPFALRSYSGLELQTRDIAIRRVIQEEYQARGLPCNHISYTIATQLLSEDKEYAASLETRLSGVCLELAHVTPATVKGFVDFMATMKAIDINTLEARLGISIPSRGFPDLRQLRASAIEAWTRLVRQGHISAADYGDGVDDLIERKTALIDQIGDRTPRNVLLHADIKDLHILVDAESGRISGILDWADASIGNPAEDISGLVLCVGAELATKIAQEVGYDSHEIMQGIVKARCERVLRLEEVITGADTESPLEWRKRQLAVALL